MGWVEDFRGFGGSIKADAGPSLIRGGRCLPKARSGHDLVIKAHLLKELYRSDRVEPTGNVGLQAVEGEVFGPGSVRSRRLGRLKKRSTRRKRGYCIIWEQS